MKQKKPCLSIKNVKARLDFARAHLDWTIDDWCWGRDPHELSTRIVTETVKHGGEGIMVWGSMTSHGHGSVYKIEGRLKSTWIPSNFRANNRCYKSHFPIG